MVPDGLRVSEILERCWRGVGGQRAECTGTRKPVHSEFGLVWETDGSAWWSGTANLSWAFPHSRGLIEPPEL